MYNISSYVINSFRCIRKQSYAREIHTRYPSNSIRSKNEEFITDTSRFYATIDDDVLKFHTCDYFTNSYQYTCIDCFQFFITVNIVGNRSKIKCLKQKYCSIFINTHSYRVFIVYVWYLQIMSVKRTFSCICSRNKYVRYILYLLTNVWRWISYKYTYILHTNIKKTRIHINKHIQLILRDNPSMDFYEKIYILSEKILQME